MLLADGSGRARSRRATDPDLLWATIGGMGLTGIILDATVRLLADRDQPHASSTPSGCRTSTSLLERMEAGDHRYRYSVAWIDLVATGAAPRSQRC